MSYSIKLIAGDRANKDGLVSIRIQVLVNRMKVYAPTIVKVRLDQFNGSKIVNHERQTKLNAAITAQVGGIEDRLLDELRKDGNVSKSRLEEVVKDKQDQKDMPVVKYIDSLQDGLRCKISAGRLKHYAVISGKVAEFAPSVRFSDITIPWLNKFEAFLRSDGIANNTVVSNMSILRAILNRAQVDGLIDLVQFAGYKSPRYLETLPVYLEEHEIVKVYDLAKSLGDGNLKLSAYYFLLSCYAGYRISDARTFKYEDKVHDGKIVLRAAKNGKIVSIAIHSRLKVILDYIKDKPITITEEHIRKFVKEACGLAGIKKEVKFHTSRHSFAMLLMSSGFTIDDVAHLIGDTAAIARVYAKIHNPTLNAKVLDLLG